MTLWSAERSDAELASSYSTLKKIPRAEWENGNVGVSTSGIVLAASMGEAAAPKAFSRGTEGGRKLKKGLPYDAKALNSAKQKIKQAEKYAGTRNVRRGKVTSGKRSVRA
jgi:hypothetical protein